MDGDKISERVVVPIFIQPPPDLKKLYRNEQDLNPDRTEEATYYMHLENYEFFKYINLKTTNYYFTYVSFVCLVVICI